MRVNFITTIITMRAPGMTMFRMPIFTWNTLVTSILVLMAFPVLAAAIFAAAADRVFGAHIYDPANGGVILWQHLFWFFGHPEVYIIALPFFGIVSEVFPVFSRKPIFGYKTLIYATIAIAALSVTVWAHHMYVTGSVLLPFFALMTMLIAVPTGVKIFNWIGTMWRGSVTFETPHALGDRLPHHLHVRWTHRRHPRVAAARLPRVRHVLRGRALPLRGLRHRRVRHVRGLLLLVAQVDRQDAQRALGKWHFWLLFIGFHTTFLIQHWLGVVGMPRRYATYLPEDGITWMNQLSTIGAGILAVSMIPFFLNVYITARGRRRSPSTTRGATAARSSGRRQLPAAASQLHVDPAHPLGVAGVRPEPPRGRHPGRHRPGEGRTAMPRPTTRRRRRSSK